MALHDIDPVDDVARPDGTRATADLTQAAARDPCCTKYTR